MQRRKVLLLHQQQGLHFTPEPLEKLKLKGVELEFVTLHVGLGTFRPVSAETIEDHEMHSEFFVVSQETADRINAAKETGPYHCGRYYICTYS